MEKAETKRVQALKAHLALNVKNVERSTEFYRRMLGLEPSKVRAGYAKFDVENPPLNLTLNQAAVNERGALSHLGIQLASTEDVLVMRERWAEAGLITRDEMQTNCCYALQDKTWVHDPDGNEWEAFVVLEDNLKETTACCVTDEKGQNVCATTGEVVAETDQTVSCCTPQTVEIGGLQRSREPLNGFQ
ncbi:MAG TPA: ArsI/CadI family heavy metal resistance metalloenzyme [Pyrinomonadaceae bacterium]|nr:ArsI/CadI family heavy metal resistance metalloenzyme [Pyrinomonadaceae bacterium]